MGSAKREENIVESSGYVCHLEDLNKRLDCKLMK